MSVILFSSLYKFYQGLKTIRLEFEVDKCLLMCQISAFSVPIIMGFFYIGCIVGFDYVA